MGAGIDFCGMIDRYLSLDGALGAELQQAMTPAEAVELLKDGVRRSTSGETSTRLHKTSFQDVENLKISKILLEMLTKFHISGRIQNLK